jgi:biopolymer transport protein ExbD
MKRIIEGGIPATAKINVTPIIDVSLTLVIILLMTAPMLCVPDVEVDLPTALTRGAENEFNVSITLGKNGELAINETVVRPELFAATLRAVIAKASNENMLIVVRADRDAPYGMIRETLGTARAAGGNRLAVATLQSK